MDQNRKTYYIWMPNGQISQDPEASSWNFKIEATDEEISTLREYFDQNYSSEWQTFFRAHVPFIPYHHDKGSEAYDRTLQQVYKLIHSLGDEEAKQHIESMGIVDEENKGLS